MPVTGSSRPLSWEMVQDGVRRRSEETSGAEFDDGEGTVIRMGRSGAV
jgi:hypothetical protein